MQKVQEISSSLEHLRFEPFNQSSTQLLMPDFGIHSAHTLNFTSTVQCLIDWMAQIWDALAKMKSLELFASPTNMVIHVWESLQLDAKCFFVYSCVYTHPSAFHVACLVWLDIDRVYSLVHLGCVLIIMQLPTPSSFHTTSILCWNLCM